MIQTIVYLSITTVVFIVLFIVTYAKYRKLEREMYCCKIDKLSEDLYAEIKEREKLERELENAENISFQNEMKDILGES